MNEMERGWKANVEISPNCPRCGSSNTKFCYYNNYSLTQPRYFCKACRRYWTKGGSLRNVPVGGGCRKNRRSKPNLNPSSSHPKLHSNPHNSQANFGILPNGSHSNPDGSQDIDLAIVYANFLNHKPASKETQDQPELNPCEDFDSLCLSSNIAANSTASFCGFPMQECGFEGSDLQFGLESSFEQKIQRSEDQLELPPFPGEDMVGWSSSLIMVNHHRLGMEAQDQNLLSGNWSPIDLSSYDTRA